MAAQIIDGEKVAAEITEKLKVEIEELKAKGRGPHLHAIQANDDPGSRFYVKSQKQSCEDVGILYTLDELPPDSSEEALIEHVKKLNADRETTGIILQMPVPQGVDGRKIQSMIAPEKDVEGMHPANMGRLMYTRPDAIPVIGPCTPLGVVELIRSMGIEMEGKNVTVVGHSEIVGKPMALLMLGLNATTRVVHIFTKDLVHHTKDADVLIVAAGKSGAVYGRYSSARRKYKKDPANNPKPDVPDISPLVKADMIMPGAIVIDVAINRIPVGFDENGEPIKSKKTGKTRMQTVGDVDFEAAKETASYITPVPGGVGPMTVAMLLRNTVETAKMTR